MDHHSGLFLTPRKSNVGVPRERFAKQWFPDPSFFCLWLCRLPLRLPRGVELSHVTVPAGKGGWRMRSCHVPGLFHRWVAPAAGGSRFSSWGPGIVWEGFAEKVLSVLLLAAGPP